MVEVPAEEMDEHPLAGFVEFLEAEETFWFVESAETFGGWFFGASKWVDRE